MKPRHAFRMILGVLLMGCATGALGQGSATSVLPALKQGGHVIVLRHGATDAAHADVYPLDFNDPAKQRQLSEEGRQAGRQIGASFTKLGVPVGEVYSSRLTRAAETARLITGRNATLRDDLNDSSAGSASAMKGSSGGGSAAHGEALRKLAATSPRVGTNTLIVTHKTNITDAFGKAVADIGEGESLVFKPGDTTPIARIKVSDWTTLSR